jgi:hypothetical protein
MQLRIASVSAIAVLGVAGTGCSSSSRSDSPPSIEKSTRRLGVPRKGDVPARRRVLYAGVHFGVDRRLIRYTDAESRQRTEHAFELWHAAIHGRAARWPQFRFDNPGVAGTERRLANFARKHRFRVVSLRWLKPKQLAPEIKVRTTHYVELAGAIGRFLQSIGTGYEGYYFEADDERGLPFLYVTKFRRGRSGGGSYWARSDALMPFAHL